LLVFTLGPHRERRRRRLLPLRCAGQELDLHRACLDAALAAGREAGCRLRVAAPRRLPLAADVATVAQSEGSFGRRLASAVRAVADEVEAGVPLVVVGSDVPGLGAAHLRQALARLAEDRRRVVLGPSPDGGIYLLASRAPLADLLAEVSWCRHDTAERLRSALEAAGFEVELLEPQADLDAPADLEHWLAARRPAPPPAWQALLLALSRLLAQLRRPLLPPVLGRPLPAAQPVRRGRAPPSRPHR
jgi:glycosyltransferase A (GT-A) superfamily protein (DUF2064 family)